jgi:hypothetical protein
MQRKKPSDKVRFTYWEYLAVSLDAEKARSMF